MNLPVSSSREFQKSTYPVLISRIIVAGASFLLIAQVILKIRDGLFFDDAYMFVRYAHNIIEYGNYGWNAGEHTYGCTNIPFTYFIVVLKLLHLDKLLGLSAMLILASFFWALASLFLLYKTIIFIGKNTLANYRWLVLMFVSLVSIADVFSFNIITGMDTMMSVFFNTLMIYLLFKYLERPGKLSYLLAVFFSYFVFLLRPDGGIYMALVPFLLFIEARMPFKKIVVFYLGIGAFLIADTVIKYLYFGNALPLPFFIKKGGFYEGYVGASFWNPFTYTFDFLYEFSFIVFLFLLYATKKSLRKFLVFALPVSLSIIYFFTVVQIMGFNSRYYLPSMPFWIIGAIYALKEVKSFAFNKFSFVLPAVFACILMVVHSLVPVYKIYVDNKTKKEASKFKLTEEASSYNCKKLTYNDAVKGIQKVIDVLPDSTTIAATEHGIISAYSPGKKILDLCGLHSLDIAINGYRDDILKQWKPDFIWLPATDYTSLRKNVIAGNNFKELYTYFPGAFNYGVAVLKTSPHYDVLTKKVIELNCQ